MDDLTIPPHLRFADLALEWADDGERLLFNPAPLAAIALANGLEPETITGDDDAAMAVIATWYVQHREAGGAQESAIEAVVARLSLIEDLTDPGQD